MKDEIRISENNILKGLFSLSKNSLRDDHYGPSAEIASDCEYTISVQPASDRLDSDQENINPNESFIGVQPNLYDTTQPIWTILVVEYTNFEDSTSILNFNILAKTYRLGETLFTPNMNDFLSEKLVIAFWLIDISFTSQRSISTKVF